MSDAEYVLLPHRRIGELAPQIYGLTRSAFASYPGVLEPSEAHRGWYVRRPGMDPDLSQAIIHEGQLVGSVFVTVAGVRLGGRLRPTGIIDTVMTHPGHRRRGLARRLLTAAIAGMRSQRLEASLLYTLPGSVPYYFYQSLGYRPHAPLRYLRRVQPASAPAAFTVEVTGPGDGERLIAFLNDHYAGYDGYVPYDDALWRWRRVERPPELPADTYLVRDGKALLGTVTVCRAPVVASTAGSASYILTDLVIAPGADAAAVLIALLSPIPPGAEVLALCPEVEAAMDCLLEGAGFSEQGGEAGMVLPLSAGVEQVLASPPEHWYPLIESVIGV